MIFPPITARRALAWTILLALATSAQARDLYRYRNTQGNVVVDYRVPSEYVGSGYEVLNDEGIVIRVVPRELSEEEREARNAEEKLEDAAKAELERLRQWDENLMLRYSTVMDIEAARDRALQDLQIRLSILKGNRRSIKQKVENYQSQAADMERAGMSVDVERLRAIEQLQGEIAATDRAITERQREIQVVEEQFAADIERFEMLQEVVELRSTLRTKK